MRRNRLPIFVLILLLLCFAVPLHASTVSVGVERPVATSFDATGALYVLSFLGDVTKVAFVPQPIVVATFGAPGANTGELDAPQDLIVDTTDRVVVADFGNHRLTLFESDGSPLGDVATIVQPQRIAQGPGGDYFVLGVYDDRLTVEQLDSMLVSQGTIDVSVACALRTGRALLGDMHVDDGGVIWVTELQGCGGDYSIRGYAADGSLIEEWTHAANQLDLATLAQHNYDVQLVSDLFVEGDEIFAILGVGGTESGGLKVDVFDRQLGWSRRVTLVGPARSLTRGSVHQTEVWLPDTDGTEAVISVPLSSL